VDPAKEKFDFLKYIPAFLVGSLFLLNILPLLAPILAYFGETKISGFIYWLYSFTCHQKGSRSIFICDHQYGWCARCTFLWMSTLITSGLIFYFRPTFSYKGASLKVAALLCLPLALDGGIQLLGTMYSILFNTAPFYESTNTLRAITGILFGLGIGLYMFPRLRDELKTN